MPDTQETVSGELKFLCCCNPGYVRIGTTKELMILGYHRQLPCLVLQLHNFDFIRPFC